MIICYPDAHGPSYGGVWGLKSLGFEGPRAVWSVWVELNPCDVGSHVKARRRKTSQNALRGQNLLLSLCSPWFSAKNHEGLRNQVAAHPSHQIDQHCIICWLMRRPRPNRMVRKLLTPVSLASRIMPRNQPKPSNLPQTQQPPTKFTTMFSIFLLLTSSDH